MIKPRSSRLYILLGGILILTLACNFLDNLTPGTESPSAETPSSLPESSAETLTPESGEETLTQIDLWLEATASLRSVNLELVTTYSNREPQILSAQIDSTGNIHLSLAMPLPEEIAATPDVSSLGDFELFVIDGIAYTRIGEEDPATQDNSYLSMLSDTLLGPEGPGLWLNILPEEDYTPAGKESYGGFNAAKYSVDGQLEKGTVTGTIWVADQSDALVGAELTVSEGLFFPPGSNQGGDVRITLTVSQAQVQAITLP